MTQERPTEGEALARIQDIDDDPVTLHGVAYVYDTQYAWVYLVSKTQQYNDNHQLHLRYAALSKPDAYQMDQYKDGGMSIRMVDGMENILPAMVARACNEGFAPDHTDTPLYSEVKNDAGE